MRFAVLTTALAAAASLRRAGGLRHEEARKRVYPELQHADTYEDDFVHDDTEHPDAAIKVNIKESEERLQSAEVAMKELEGKLGKAKASYAAASSEFTKHAEETEHAKEMVSKYNSSLHGVADIKAGIESANTNLTTAMDALNVTDTDATAAAEEIKTAEEAFHKANLLVVDAKENVSLAEEVLEGLAKKVEAAHTANVSLDEWKQKLNSSQSGSDSIVQEVTTSKKAYDDVHAHYKAAEARLSEAQRMFEVDKETYEQLVGPYTGPGEEAEDDSGESLWWDVLTGNAWSANVDKKAPTLS